MSKTEFQESFRRLSGQIQMPGLNEGVKDEAYKDGMSAGQAVAKVIQMGWANRPANDSLAAWMKIVDKYVGEEFKEFINDPQWLKGFQSALTGHYGKAVKIEAKQSAPEEYAKLSAELPKRLKSIESLLTTHATKQAKKPESYGYVGDLKHINELLAEIEAFLRSAR